MDVGDLIDRIEANREEFLIADQPDNYPSRSFLSNISSRIPVLKLKDNDGAFELVEEYKGRECTLEEMNWRKLDDVISRLPFAIGIEGKILGDILRSAPAEYESTRFLVSKTWHGKTEDVRGVARYKDAVEGLFSDYEFRAQFLDDPKFIQYMAKIRANALGKSHYDSKDLDEQMNWAKNRMKGISNNKHEPLARSLQFGGVAAGLGFMASGFLFRDIDFAIPGLGIPGAIGTITGGYFGKIRQTNDNSRIAKHLTDFYTNR